ncbi:hypothetical protein K170097C1_45960 [Hungatella effluvii]
MLIMRLEIKDFGKCSIRFRQLYKQKETARACRFFLFINYVTVYALAHRLRYLHGHRLQQPAYDRCNG